ncbi:glycosyltransferase family 2 protein [Nocardioides alkalitolerans]|uniref:glycosyltransferase family 2 protein n=1 Tax=Nocardioides alkalitolerans TaxID=281714 RepID=UPI0009FFABF3|nr:glycosyltransferase family 2 protein [Nocardioides alkalitolerans]
METLAIVTPSYNQGPYLERTIQSVLDQNDPSLRYAVVDGGSRDNSTRIIRKYEKYLAFWCSEPDKGQTDAILKGFRAVGGDIRGWINSDDEYVPGSFAKVRKVFATRPEVGLVYGERVLIGPASEVLGWTRQPAFDPSKAGFNIPSETAFWRSTVESRAGSLDGSLQFAMDLDFFSRLYLAAPTVKLNSYLGKFRAHEESKSSTIPEVGREEAAERWRRHFGDNEMWSIQPPRLYARHLAAGLRRPLLLGAPYARHRLLRLTRRMTGGSGA